ncbi:MAG: 30S ribosomal protein S1 [Chloroflexaceae bacterium]|nr:30S ribosomal protein S1 [Chloroflexaceae bacterium]
MEQFRADPAPNYPRLQYGETIEGTIMRIDRDSLLVDIGAKSEGIVQLREMQSLTPEQREAFRIGDELLVFVIQAEDREGHAVLSIDRARQEKSWRQLQRCYERGETVEAPVINYNKGGLLVDLDGVRGFVPSSQVDGISRETDAQKQSDMARMVGQSLVLKVIEMNRDRNRLILSERQARQDVREEKKEALLSSLQEGHVCTGMISSLCDFGAFVDIGGADGLVHLSELSWGRVNHPSEILRVGQEVQVYILSIDNDRKRIALSIKRTQDEPWATVGERYHLGQVIEGTITQLAPFGAFLCLEEGVEGLIHISEMSDGRIQHPREVVQEGDVVQARIIRIDPTRKRIGLSLHLSPKDETGADPHSDDEESKDQGCSGSDNEAPRLIV